MLNLIEEMSLRKIFSIIDLAKIVNKRTDTIRKWEKKGIISKCSKYGENGWRQYNVEDMIKILEEILNHNWQRTVIHNPGQLQLLINNLQRLNRGD